VSKTESNRLQIHLVENSLHEKAGQSQDGLVADENPTLRKVLCKISEVEKDYDLCAEVVDGAQAIALARQCRPDLIILDLNMPVINGIDAARALKQIILTSR